MPGSAFPEFTVAVDDPPAVIVAGLRLTEGPAGATEADRLTLAADPAATAVEMGQVPDWFVMSERVAGAEIEKSLVAGGEVTVTLIVALWVIAPSVPFRATM
jgi:hypothetical protein